MEAFKVATYDQNLMVNGVYLTENEASLGQLKVLPGSLIFLRVSLAAYFRAKEEYSATKRFQNVSPG